ncbi:hypothetical protein ACJMK2_035797 [Sinanodonta woodiana]|uniref:Histidine-specific methyltransferase SAM-dependent domain-containing protein n=1 Tax=Sinanodonta woodiana TaxID=1069815 RepID=A0ABD3WF69_SINWO
MDIRDAVRQGLTSSPRYLPVWFRYDKTGSILNDRCLTDNKYYYFHKSELDIIQRYIDEMVCQVKFPCSIVDLGSGNAIKTRIFIDALLKYQEKLKYIPVDISEADDRLLITLDITQNEEEILNAYLDPTGICGKLYLNALHRLNREFQANFKIDNFKLEASFSRDLSAKGSSAVIMRVRSTCKHEVCIPGLNLTLLLEEGEYINLFEGEGVSHKYTLDQIRGLAEDGQLHIEKIWTDSDNHVACVMFSKLNNLNTQIDRKPL